MEKFAIIVAAGLGTRMKNNTPKQFLLIKNKPVLWYSINAFLKTYNDINIVLVIPEEYIETVKQIAAMFEETQKINVTIGGITRFHSVQNGLKTVSKNSIVFVHDAVRCLVSHQLIQRCYNDAVAHGSAVPSIAVTDSVRILKNDYYYSEDRCNIRIVQTPQTFLSDILLAAYEQEYKDAFTDDATVVESYGEKIFLTDGEYDNIKITRPVDLLIAEKIIEERMRLL